MSKIGAFFSKIGRGLKTAAVAVDKAVKWTAKKISKALRWTFGSAGLAIVAAVVAVATAITLLAAAGVAIPVFLATAVVWAMVASALWLSGAILYWAVQALTVLFLAVWRWDASALKRAWRRVVDKVTDAAVWVIAKLYNAWIWITSTRGAIAVAITAVVSLILFLLSPVLAIPAGITAALLVIYYVCLGYFMVHIFIAMIMIFGLMLNDIRGMETSTATAIPPRYSSRKKYDDVDKTDWRGRPTVGY